MSEAGGRTSAAALLGAVLPLLVLPLAAAAYGVFVSDDHELDRTALAVWDQNRVALTVIAAAGLVAGVGCALGLYAGLQRGAVSVFAVAPASGLVLVVGAVFKVLHPGSTLLKAGLTFGLQSPALIVGLLGESMWVLAEAQFVAVALLVAASLACLLGAVGPHRRLVLWAAALFFVHALLLLAVSARELWLVGLLHEAVHAGDDQVLPTIVAGSPSLPDLRALALLAIGALLGVLVAGARGLRDTPRAAFLFAFLGLTGLVGPGSVVASSALMKRQLQPGLPAPHVQLLTLESERTGAAPVVVLDARGAVSPTTDAPLERDELMRALGGASPPVAIGLRASARPADLTRLLEAVNAMETRFAVLVGLHHTSVVGVAPELRFFLEPFADAYRGVAVSVGEEPVPGEARFEPARFETMTELVKAAEALVAAGQHPFVHVGPAPAR